MKTRTLLLGAFTLGISLGFFSACDNNNNNNKPENTVTPEATAKLDMTAPKMEANMDGLVSLEDCPMSNPHLAVTVSEDFTTAHIIYDGKEIQTVKDEDFELASDAAPIHFLDANFDGYTDIFIGTGQSRTANSLFVWNEKSQKFDRVEGSALQGVMLEPKTKSFVMGGSNSASEFYITRSLWNGIKLDIREQLSIITSPDEYANNNVEHMYTVKSSDDNVLCSSETIDGLPKIWQNYVKAYGF